MLACLAMEMLIYPTQIILLLFGTYVSLVTCLCSDFSIGQCIPRPGDIVNTLQVPVGTEISTAWGICKSMCGFYGCNYISYDKSTRVCVLMDLGCANILILLSLSISVYTRWPIILVLYEPIVPLLVIEESHKPKIRDNLCIQKDLNMHYENQQNLIKYDEWWKYMR